MKDIPQGFERICKVTDLKNRIGKRFIVNDIDIAVFQVDGNIYALGNICPHQHSPIIYDGYIEESKVVCPAHGWEFNLKDGNLDTGGRGLDSYDVLVLDEIVYVKCEQKQLKW